MVSNSAQLPTVDEVAEWLRNNGVAVFKLPQRSETVDVLLRNPANKVMRQELRLKVLERIGDMNQENTDG